jgi:hypothetical protein
MQVRYGVRYSNSKGLSAEITWSPWMPSCGTGSMCPRIRPAARSAATQFLVESLLIYRQVGPPDDGLTTPPVRATVGLVADTGTYYDLDPVSGAVVCPSVTTVATIVEWPPVLPPSGRHWYEGDWVRYQFVYVNAAGQSSLAPSAWATATDATNEIASPQSDGWFIRNVDHLAVLRIQRHPKATGVRVYCQFADDKPPVPVTGRLDVDHDGRHWIFREGQS